MLPSTVWAVLKALIFGIVVIACLVLIGVLLFVVGSVIWALIKDGCLRMRRKMPELDKLLTEVEFERLERARRGDGDGDGDADADAEMLYEGEGVDYGVEERK